MKASYIIGRLSSAIEETGQDVEVLFVMDVEHWHPPLNLHVQEIDAELPYKYGATFRLTARGQYVQQTDEGYRFQEVAARAWADQKKDRT